MVFQIEATWCQPLAGERADLAKIPHYDAKKSRQASHLIPAPASHLEPPVPLPLRIRGHVRPSPEDFKLNVVPGDNGPPPPPGVGAASAAEGSSRNG